jgi:hypothetical protein
LITQLEMITSIACNPVVDLFDLTFEKSDVGRARLRCVAPGQVEHLVGHVEAVALCPSAPTRLADSSTSIPPPEPAIQDCFAHGEVGDGDRVATTQAGQAGVVRYSVEVVVQRCAQAGIGGCVHGLSDRRQPCWQRPA